MKRVKGEKRVRKPKKIEGLVEFDKDQHGEFISITWICSDDDTGLKEAKRLHNWLGRAIAYLEQVKGER